MRMRLYFNPSRQSPGSPSPKHSSRLSQKPVGLSGLGSISASSAGRVAAVASRRRQSAEAFACKFSGATAVEGVEALLQLEDIDAVYVATPTSAKEPIVLAALAAGKHVLVDKPFASAASVQRMREAATGNGRVIMDATHFVHHPRTGILKNSLPETVGDRRSLHAAFYTPMADKSNIRYDTAAEPMGCLGDLGWYAMRAIVEYLQPAGKPAKTSVVAERDPGTGAVIRATGVMGFDSGEQASFEVGFTANTGVMDLRLTGSRGVIFLDDFPLDWTNSIAWHNADIEAGYFHRCGRATRKDVNFVKTPSAIPADVLMIDDFADLVRSSDIARRKECAAAMFRTQDYLDAAWRSLN